MQFLEFNNYIPSGIYKRTKYHNKINSNGHKGQIPWNKDKKMSKEFYNKRNNKLKNLITLCRSCHSKTNFKRNDWINYFEKRVDMTAIT